MVDVWADDFPLSSFHCRSPRKMHLSKMDPSCCIGFYCATKDDFFNLIDVVEPVSVYIYIYFFLLSFLFDLLQNSIPVANNTILFNSMSCLLMESICSHNYSFFF